MKKTAIRPMHTLPCARASVRRLARAMTQVYDRALRPCGLETAQFTLLQALEEVGPVTQGRLGQALALDSTTLSVGRGCSCGVRGDGYEVYFVALWIGRPSKSFFLPVFPGSLRSRSPRLFQHPPRVNWVRDGLD